MGRLSCAMVCLCLFAPYALGAQKPHTFAIISDYGEAGPAAAQVAELVKSWRPEFIITLGDNNYPHGEAATMQRNVIDYYGDYIGALHPGRPARFFPILGNHDWDTAGAKPYLDTFKMPHNGRYYATRQGPVALFAIDSDSHEPDGIDPSSVQAQWIKQAMLNSNAPIKLVVLHHPPFSSGRHGSRRALRWPFASWGATAVLAGHNHAYERMQVGGVTYIVMGLSGAGLDYTAPTCVVPGAKMSACTNEDHGALRATASDTSITLEAITQKGQVLDRVVIAGRSH